MKKEKAAPRQESSPTNVLGHRTPSNVQRSRILRSLERAGKQGKSTIQLREELDIMHPSGRVLELREEGHRIETIWTVTENAQGHKHRCARYILLAKNLVVAA